MRFCQSHWNQLRDKVKESGMFHLVSTSGEQAAKRMQKEIAGKPTVPDPLLEAHNMMLKRAIECLGIGVMGDCCPLCEANKHLPNHPETNECCSDAWINSIIPYLKDEYIKEGWLNNN